MDEGINHYVKIVQFDKKEMIVHATIKMKTFGGASMRWESIQNASAKVLGPSSTHFCANKKRQQKPANKLTYRHEIYSVDKSPPTKLTYRHEIYSVGKSPLYWCKKVRRKVYRAIKSVSHRVLKTYFC